MELFGPVALFPEEYSISKCLYDVLYMSFELDVVIRMVAMKTYMFKSEMQSRH